MKKLRIDGYVSPDKVHSLASSMEGMPQIKPVKHLPSVQQYSNTSVQQAVHTAIQQSNNTAVQRYSKDETSFSLADKPTLMVTFRFTPKEKKALKDLAAQLEYE